MEQQTVVSVKDEEILKAIKTIKFGTVLVVIQDSEVVQIEATNKRRFDKKEAANRQLKP